MPPDKDSPSRFLPPRLDLGQEYLSCVEQLLGYERTAAEFADVASDTTSERVFGLVLPPFQRQPKWDLERQVRFVESLWLRLPVGHYVVNCPESLVDGKFHPTHSWLIDGQQRLRALKAFFDDAFPIFDLRWSELDVIQKRQFMLLPFPQFVTSVTDEATLRDLYNRLAFGGVAHEESERA